MKIHKWTHSSHNFSHITECGEIEGRYVKATTNNSKVTCKKCLKQIGKQEVKNA
jgi:hypothetical protein